MSTVYDWITVLIFIGLMAIFFLRLRSDDVPFSRYIAASIGCAVANYFGNDGQDAVAIGLIMATLFFTYRFILVRTDTDNSAP